MHQRKENRCVRPFYLGEDTVLLRERREGLHNSRWSEASAMEGSVISGLANLVHITAVYTPLIRT